MKTSETLPQSATQLESNPTTRSTCPGGPVHVWLVDDQASLRALIAVTLERLGGIVCTRQFHSPNALLSALASRVGPDVILLDVQMGEANGIDAIPAIKSLSRSTRVLMLTTCYDMEWHRRALESGAAGYLLKTDSPERLVGSICARGGAGDDDLMRAVPVRINVRRRQTNCAGGKTAQKQPAGQRPVRKATALVRWLKRFGKN
jgi:DNA-binding NarL/FixJ family response regulator